MSSDFGSEARFKIVNTRTRLILSSFLEDLINVNAFHSRTGDTKGVSLSLCEVTALSVQVTVSIYLVSAVASCRAEPSQIRKKSFALSATPFFVELTHRVIAKRISVAPWN